MKKNFLILGLLTTTNLFAMQQFEVFQGSSPFDAAPNPFLVQGPLPFPHASQEKTLQQKDESLKKKAQALPKKHQEKFEQEQNNWHLQKEPEEARVAHLEEARGSLEQQNFEKKLPLEQSFRTPTQSTQTTVLEQDPTPFNRQYLPPTSAMVYNPQISDDGKNNQSVRTEILKQYKELSQSHRCMLTAEVIKMKKNVATRHNLYKANDLENQQKQQSRQTLNASNKELSFFEEIINSISTSIGRFLSYFSRSKR
jgi:hypothetical protein